MRFTGKVRIPDVDHPGIPAIFEIEDNYAEVLLDGDSLGRWSLFDVHASRLVSSAFSIKAGGDEITFVADEPVDFAYKGVEHMAEVWARYKTMTLPRRLVSVKRSRRNTRLSRIPELRNAMMENLGSRPPTFYRDETPAEMRVEAPPEAAIVEDLSPAFAVESSGFLVEEPAAEEPSPAVPAEASALFAEELAPEELAPEELEPQEPSRRPLMPGPGLMARRISKGEEDQIPEHAGIVEPTPADDPARFEVEEVSQSTADAAPAEPAPVAASPEDSGELVASTPAAGNGSGPGRRLVVDLAEFEDPERESAPKPELGEVGPELEPALIGAIAEKSGLFNAVRAAFVRSREPHQHDFVEAPGGIGLTRRICSECGHISIGSTD